MTLTVDGFVRPTLPEIKTDLDSDLNNALGPVNTNPDAVLGQISGIVSEAISTVYEILQDNYDSMYPSTAEGTSLDGAVSYVGIDRLEASKTIVTAAAYGLDGTFIQSGVLATAASSEFESTSDVIISRSNVLDVEIEVNTVSNSAGYQILAGGEVINYTSDSSATEAEILAGLLADVPVSFVGSVSGGKLRLYSADGVSPFTIAVDSKLTISKVGSPIVFAAKETGAIVVPVGGLTSIGTPVDGWETLYNLVAGDAGRDVESDVDLRARHAKSVRGTGSATIEAIKARMLADVDGVTSIAIYDNRTALAVDGIPPHAFESVIEGGTNSAIASQLWLTKPAAIETHGNVTVLTKDSTGANQTIKFSRPVTVYGWLTVAVNSLNTEETLPATAATGIKSACVFYANANIGVGDDVIIQRFIGAIYSAVSGLGSITITADVTASSGDTPTYSSANIEVSRAEIAKFDVSRIVVTGL